MRRYLIISAVVILSGLASSLAAEEKLYHLSKVPRFGVGDKVTDRETYVVNRSVATSDGVVVEDGKERKESRFVYEVLEVNEKGRIQAFRVTIISAKKFTAATLPKQTAYKKEISLEKVHFIARRKGMEFDADTTTVVSGKSETLKASQIAMLKEYCKDGIDFAGYPETDVMLLPPDPVPVGYVWKPSRKVLDAWTNASSSAKKMKDKTLSAEFKLVSVTDGIAVVEGTIRLQATFMGTTFTAPMKVTMRIDTASGRWVGQSMHGIIVLKVEDTTIKLDTHNQESTTFAPGSGTASALPENVRKLGWKKPEKGTNSHKDAANGFSINVPAGYAAQKVSPGGSRVAQFADEHGRKIMVTRADSEPSFDAEELIPVVIGGMKKKISDYELVGREDISLSGNVPAVLLAGRAHEGKVIILTLVAIDGSQVVSVSTAAPVDDEELTAKLRKSLKTVRVFEQDVTKAP